MMKADMLLKSLLTQIWRTVRVGWDLLGHLSRVKFLLSIFGITAVPSGVITGALAYYGEHSAALLIITFCLVSAITLLAYLGITGYGQAQREVISRPTNFVVGDTKPIPDMLLKEAAEHLSATKSWDVTSNEVWAELRQAARDGRITVWGRPESAHLERPHKPMEEIPPDHWRHYAFDFLRCMHSEDEVRCRSEPDDPKRHPLNKGYADLRLNATQVRTSWPAKMPSDALRIEIGDGAPFNTYVERLHTKTHLIRIGVVNGIQGKAVTNCQLRLEQITGSSSERCPITIKQNFIINGGVTEYIPLAEFDERINKSRPAPSKPGLIRLHFPLTRPLSNGISYLNAGSYELTLLATSAETPPASQKCRLVLEDGFLSLQRL